MKNKHTQVVDFSNPNADKITSSSTTMSNNKQNHIVDTNNEQSSVEYYIIKLIDILGDEICNKITVEQSNRIAKLEKQAKAMHKEEMRNFADKMRMVDDVDFDGNITFSFNIEENYKETFES